MQRLRDAAEDITRYCEEVFALFIKIHREKGIEEITIHWMIAFSRSGDLSSGTFEDAQVLKKFGDTPDDLGGLSAHRQGMSLLYRLERLQSGMRRIAERGIVCGRKRTKPVTSLQAA